MGIYIYIYIYIPIKISLFCSFTFDWVVQGQVWV